MTGAAVGQHRIVSPDRSRCLKVAVDAGTAAGSWRGGLRKDAGSVVVRGGEGRIIDAG